MGNICLKKPRLGVLVSELPYIQESLGHALQLQPAVSLRKKHKNRLGEIPFYKTIAAITPKINNGIL